MIMEPTLLISDIQEKETASPKAPTFPQFKSSSTGFPEHKKRSRLSAFKQKRQLSTDSEKKPSVFTTASAEPLDGSSNGVPIANPAASDDPLMDAKSSIDRENNARLATMTDEEIEKARLELFNGMDSSLLEILLKRANLDEKHGKSPFDEPESATAQQDPPQTRVEDAATETKPAPRKRVTFAEDNTAPSPAAQATTQAAFEQRQHESVVDDDTAPSVPPEDHIIAEDAHSKPHWPKPPQTADLDPSDPDFLSSLHTKYFPSLPADPSKLAWMSPVPTPNSPADYDSPYHPSQTSLPVTALRFDFRGALLPPKISRAIPVTKGLHHHGEAPEAAGYTVAELAMLARSAVPGQRCMAYQTLGRIMYRLGRGEFGGPGDVISDGVWGQMVEGKIMESLYEEAGMDLDGGLGDGKGRGHRTAHAFAVEAIWLFEKGGFKERIRRGK
ncbi:RPAP1-like protein [Pseudomassariella vexata]|uniref:RPAP1-like protein n=1 Tax=Pseudomassariella vexata TaxID=1141098 RepID=A0A1Y2DHI1_9PEZI|nr:RPAP1-like protein [Pseudomassariella vexata]ORY58703.1 RPAP1-like protein [Pseudomassariella vexata]